VRGAGACSRVLPRGRRRARPWALLYVALKLSAPAIGATRTTFSRTCRISSSKRLTYAWTPYALAVFRALAAEVKRVLLYLFASTGVLDKVPDVDDALVAGVGRSRLA
jgi:hypothetical protein